MIPHIQNTVERYANEYDMGRVLEIGSYDVNGGVRWCFNDGYVGIDMRAGPGVDFVCNSHSIDWLFGLDTFDSVLWLETIEHDDAWWETLDQIDLVLKPGGYLVISTPEPRMPVHSYPDDYWRFVKPGFLKLFDGYDILHFDFGDEADGEQPITSYIGIGRKR